MKTLVSDNESLSNEELSMGKIEFAVYDPPEKGMPFLAVRINGVKTQFKKVIAIAAKSRIDAEAALETLEKDLSDPHWRDREELHSHYGSRPPEGK